MWWTVPAGVLTRFDKQAGHPRGLGGLKTLGAVLDDETARGRNGEALGGKQKEVGRGFCVLDILAGDHDLEQILHPDATQGAFNTPTMPAAGDGKFYAGLRAFAGEREGVLAGRGLGEVVAQVIVRAILGLLNGQREAMALI